MKIIMLLPRVPYPLEKGDKLRAFHQLRILSRKHEIFLFCLNDTQLHPDSLHKLKPYCAEIHIHDLTHSGITWNLIRAAFTSQPFQVGYYSSGTAKKKLLKLVERVKPDHLYCQLVRTAPYGKTLKIKKTIDYQDVFSKGLERRIETEPWYYRWVLRLEHNRMLRYENEVFDLFDNKTIISVPDRDLIPHQEKQNIIVIPNGVNFDYFQPQSIDPVYDLLFTGNMAYPPNIDSTEYLVRDILPLIHLSRPETTLLIAGAHPQARVRALQSDKVTIGGWIRDMRDCYSQASVFVAPMRLGTGLQNKLLEAMSMELPCITSQLANNALQACEGKEIVVGMTTEDYAEKILDLLLHPEKARMLGTAGGQYVRSNFDWEVCTGRLEELISNTH